MTNSPNSIIEGFGFLFVFLILLAIITLILAWPFMWLWNYSMPAAFSIANEINYWQAYALVMLVVFVSGPTKTNNSSK